MCEVAVAKAQKQHGRRALPLQKARKARPIKARVLERDDGLKIVQAGNEMWIDTTGMRESDLAEFRSGIDGYGQVLPRLINESTHQVEELLRALPTLPTLANLAAAVFMVNPETYVEWKHDRIANEVEWCTRVALSMSGPVPLTGDYPVLDSVLYGELNEALRELYEHLAQFNAWQRVDAANRGDHLGQLRARSLSHQTSIRNSSFEHQTKALLHELFDPMQERLERLLGFNVSDVIFLSEYIRDEVNSRIHRRAALLKSELLELDARMREARIRGRRRDGVKRNAFSGRMAIEVADDFTFTATDVSRIHPRARAILGRFSLSFGLPAAQGPGPVDDIMLRPLVRIDEEQFFCHLAVLMIEAIKPNLEAALAEDRETWDRYADHRARVLEDRTAEYFAAAMPRSKSYPRLLYTDSLGRGELDLLVLMDRIAIFVECKAGVIRPPARRGARLRRALNAVLGDAHAQAVRAEQHLRAGGDFEFEGGTLGLSRNDFDHLFLVSITMDDVSAFTTNLAESIAAGVYRSEALWSASLADLELISDIVELNVELPLYLQRRARISRSKVTAIEEMDWFMNFISEGLYFADDLDMVGDMHLLSFTEALDNYYMYKWGPRKKEAPKPRLRLRPKVRHLMEQVEASTVPGWSSAALLLAGWGSDSQEEYVRELRNVARRDKPSGRMFFGSTSGDAVVLFGYPGWQHRAMAETYARSRMTEANVDRAILLAVNQRAPRLPPVIQYFDRGRDALPTADEAAAFLGIFTSREVHRD